MIEAALKREKSKRNLIKWIFLILDIMLVTLLIVVEAYLHYAKLQDPESWQIYLIISIFPPIFTAIFNLILAISAYYLTR